MFSACFTGFLRVRTARTTSKFEKTKEKKDRELMRCTKGILATGILGGTGFSLLQWEKGSETPSCGAKKGLRLPRSSCSDLGNEGVSDPFSPCKRESQTRFPTAEAKTPYPPQIPLAKIPLAQPITNVHLSNVHFVLCQNFGLKRLTPPFHAFFPPPLYCFHTK